VDRSGLASRVGLRGAELDLPGLITAFDIVGQGPESEGLPNALLEAAAAGRPIVAAAAGGTAEIVIDGYTGGNGARRRRPRPRGGAAPDGEDPDSRSRMGVAAREHVAAKFALDRFDQEFADLRRARGIQAGAALAADRPARNVDTEADSSQWRGQIRRTTR